MKPGLRPKRVTAGAPPPAMILSIHDVSPGSLPAVQQIIAALTPRQVERCTLLVIPGAGWTAPTLKILRDLQRRGCQLAGHGWDHRSIAPRTRYHRIHSRLLSREVAEHLSRQPAALQSLVQRCYDWFSRVQLPPPQLYVPPAWAVGALTKPMLNMLPFSMVEYPTGVYHTKRHMFRRLPLVGFEADTPLRDLLLRGWNRMNYAIACRSGRPLRVAIHPFDLQLRLAENLRKLLTKNHLGCTYHRVFTKP